MRRYWIDPEFKTPDAVVIEGELFHHIFDVCRQLEGDEFEVLPGDGRAYRVVVSELKKRQALARILSSRELPLPPRPKLHLVLASSKWATMDSSIEKCVELGVASVTPVVSKHSFMGKLSELSESKMSRWKKIIRSATQQTGRGDLMVLHEPSTLLDAVAASNRIPRGACLVLYEGDSRITLSDWLQSQNSSGLEEIVLVVGSEGGFSSSEIQEIQGFGVHPVTLGEQVLRVETACVVGVSILKYHYGLFR